MVRLTVKIYRVGGFIYSRNVEKVLFYTEPYRITEQESRIYQIQEVAIMNAASSPSFKHRPNRDGTFDTICLTCYQTVFRSHNEADLEGAEEFHTCSQRNLANLYQI